MTLGRYPIEIIAEIGSVHDGSFGNACKLVELSKACGATAVKFQTHIASAETLPNAPNPSYFQAEDRFSYFQRTAFSKPQWARLLQLSNSLGLKFISSPFSNEALDLLIDIGVSHIKVASGEVSNLPLLHSISKYRPSVYLSSGMSSWSELDAAVNALNDCKLVIMQCTSMYPCPPESVGINIIQDMSRRYNHQLGFSDHTSSISAAICALSAGATVFEKHITFSTSMYGSDALNSFEPDQFTQFVSELRFAATTLQSTVNKNDISPFREMKSIFEKSVVTSRALKSGHVISLSDLAFKKPGTGIPASQYQTLIGRSLVKDLPGNSLLDLSDLSNA